MTSPGISPTAYAARLSRASVATGGSRPSLANTLAGSDLPDSQIDLVGGFVRGMDASLVARLARQGGFLASFTPQQRAQMDALGEKHDDVDPQGHKDDPRSALESALDHTWEGLGNFAEFAVENPVSQAILSGFDKALDVVKLPWRMISSQIDTENDQEIAAAKRAQGYDPNNAWDSVQFFYNQGNQLYHDLDPLREGYENGSEMVDLAQEYFEDPEQFQDRLITDKDFESRVTRITASPDWAEVLDRVDRAHISPGRDVARVLLPKEAEGGAVFTALSGVLDATYTLALDPTLVGFKAARLARLADASTGAIAAKGLTSVGPSIRLAKIIDKASSGWYRGTIDRTDDIDGLRFAYGVDEAGRPNTQRSKNLRAWWEQVQAVRAADPEEATRLVALMDRRFPEFQPFLPDVQGKRMIPLFSGKRRLETVADEETGGTRVVDADPKLNSQIAVSASGDAEVTIERAGVRSNARAEGIMSSELAGDWHFTVGTEMKSPEEFVDYLAANHALIRSASGLAMATRPILPGRTAWRRELAYRLAVARYRRTGNGTKFAGFELDNTPTLNTRHQPIAEEREAGEELENIPDEDILSPDGQIGAAVHNILTRGTPDGVGRKHLWARARARADRRLRRLGRVLPTVKELDLHNPDHAEQVRRFMSVYMPKAHAEMMAAMWRLGDESTRRAIAKSMLEQTRHASGMSLTPAGNEWFDNFLRDQVERESRQKYGFDGNDVIKTEAGDRHVALHLNQLNHKVTLPPIRELVWLANKFNSASFLSRNVGARFMSPELDAAHTGIKLGWIAWPAGGVRNAVDEVGGIAARGWTADAIQGRHLHSKESKAFRDAEHARNKRLRELRAEHGTPEALSRHLANEIAANPEDAEIRAMAAQVIEGKIQHLIPYWARGVGDSINDKVMGVLLGKFVSAFGRAPTKDEYRYAHELVEMQKEGLTSRVINETGLYDDRAFLLGDEHAQELALKGGASAAIRFKKDGFEQVEPDGGRGADWWAATLHMIFGDPADPAHVAFRSLWEDGDPFLAKQKVIDYVNSDRMTYLRQTSEFIKHEGVEKYADTIVAQAKLATTGRGWPEWDNDLLQEIRDFMAAEERGKAAAEGDRLSGLQGGFDEDVNRRQADVTAARRERDAARYSRSEDRKIKRASARIDQMQADVERLIEQAKREESRVTPEVEERIRNRNIDLAKLAEDIRNHEANITDLTRKLPQAKPGQAPKFEASIADSKRKLEQFRAREQKLVAQSRKDAELYGGHGERIASLHEQIAKLKGSLRATKAYNSFRANRLAGPANRGRLDGADPFYERVLAGEFDEVPEELIQRLDDDGGEQVKREVLLSVLFHRLDEGEPIFYDAPDLTDDVMRGFMEESGVDEVVHPVDEEIYPGVPRDPEEAPSQLEITTQEQLAALFEHLPEAATDPSGWSLKPLPPVADEAELARTEAVHRVARQEMRTAKEKSRRNLEKTQAAFSKSVSYVHDRPLNDEQVRSFLRTVHGIEPRPGEYNNGVIHEELAQKIMAGEIPDRTFLASLPEAYRPRYALKQTYAPVLPNGTVERIMAPWTDLLARFYKHVVTDMVQAISRNPLFTAKYVMARRNTEAYVEHMVNAGWSKATAEEMAKRIALRHAEQETIKHIDNPTLASQFSVLSRNIWVFQRATEDWLRRWGRTIRDHPETVRKAQLMIHGSESVGILHLNEDNDLTFVYPGSGAFLNAMLKLTSKLPGVPDPVQIPVSPDLESKLIYTNPSLDNPFGFSATPVISVPFKWLASMFGNKQSLVLAAADKVLNGEQGANKEWYQQLLPTPVARILAGTAETDPATRAGQAMMQAIAQMEAAGAIDDLDGNDPGAVEDFFDRLSAQVENNMVFSALFGMIAPASPGLPNNAVKGKEDKAENADWAFHRQGLESLRAEWRKVADKLPFAEAQEWWVRNHPGERVWAEAHQTEVSEEADGAVAPATLTAAHFMENNKDWMKRYPGVSAYFIPQGEPGTKGGEFSDVAYRAQLEMGIRRRKDLKEFLTDVITARGERIYYDSREEYQKQKARAEHVGDGALVQQLEDEWTKVTKPGIYAANPYLRQKFAAYADNEVLRQTQMQNLILAMNDPETLRAIGPEQAIAVQEMMDAYRRYRKQRDALKGERGAQATTERARVQDDYETRIAEIVQRFPGLKDLGNGVFGIPD